VVSAPASRGAALGALAVLLGLPAAWAAGLAASGGLPLASFPFAASVILAVGGLAGRRIGRLPESVRLRAAAGAVAGALLVGIVVAFPAALPTGVPGIVALAAEQPMGRGGARPGAGRDRLGPQTVAAAVTEVRSVLDEIARADGCLDRMRAEALAARLFRDAMRLRRRLISPRTWGSASALSEHLGAR
jgi:hypothetical protein